MSNKNKNTPVVDKTAGIIPEKGTVEEGRLLAAEKAEADKLAAEKVEADKLAADKAEADKLAAEKSEADKIAAEKSEADKLAAEKSEADKLAAEADKSAADKVHDATLIPSGRFIAENGNEFEFAVGSFTFQGKVYTKEEALSDHPDVLEHLASIKSFILKKV